MADFCQIIWRKFLRNLCQYSTMTQKLLPHNMAWPFFPFLPGRCCPFSAAIICGRKKVLTLNLASMLRKMILPDNMARSVFSPILLRTDTEALVQLNGDIFLFYNKSLGDLNVEKCTHQHPRRVDGVDDVWHAYPHPSRHLYDVGIARKLHRRLYKRLF